MSVNPQDFRRINIATDVTVRCVGVTLAVSDPPQTLLIVPQDDNRVSLEITATNGSPCFISPDPGVTNLCGDLLTPNGATRRYQALIDGEMCASAWYLYCYQVGLTQVFAIESIKDANA